MGTRCGGGIINNHELTLRRVVPGNKAVLGAGVYNSGPNTDGADGSRVTVEDGIISATSANDGLGRSDSPGGIYTSDKMTVMIERSTISANTG